MSRIKSGIHFFTILNVQPSMPEDVFCRPKARITPYCTWF